MASWHDDKNYKHNDQDAIYTRGMFAHYKNWTRKWAGKLAKKYARDKNC